LKSSNLRKDEIDGLTVSSFTLRPDTAIGLTQHLGLSPRWLDHIPLGGASGVVALRRAARAVQAGDADVVACIAGDTNTSTRFRLTLANFSQFARDAVYPYGAGRTERELRVPHRVLHEATRCEARGFRQAVRRATHQRTAVRLLSVQEAADPGGVPGRAADRRAAAPVRLRDAVRGRRGISGLVGRKARKLELPYVRLLGPIERHNAFASDPVQMRAGWALDRDDLYRQAGVGRTTWTSSRLTTITR
jgi:hypothetical protein